MKIPTISGGIDRRILINFAVDPDIAEYGKLRMIFSNGVI